MLMDTFFISHGSPMMSIDETIPARRFLQSWQGSEYAPELAPKAILIVSGHWDTRVPTVNSVDRNDTIHDFYGFPRRMYELKYPAPGSPHLAKRVVELLSKAGFEHVKEDRMRGLDHGAWVPLMLMYPEADIPVCQLSVQTDMDATHHYNMGKALAPLRDEGVLIIGSGSATHNLRAIGHSGQIAQWAWKFDNWLKESVINGRHDEVNHYDKMAPHAKMAHPWPDHFYPLHVALGAAGKTAKAELMHESWEGDTLSYTSFRFAKAP